MPFILVPLLSRTCFAAQFIKPPNEEHDTTDTRSNQAALHHCKLPGKGTRKHHFHYKAAATRLKHRRWALPTAHCQHCYGLQGKGCNSHCGQLEHPVAAGHQNLGRVDLSPSASKKAKSSFLEPGPSTHDTTTGSLLWTTATSPLFLLSQLPLPPLSTPSSTTVSLPMQIQCLCTPRQAAEMPSTSHCNRRKEQDR